jgi:hypothetical protein
MALSLDRRTLFKLYYLCLIVVVVAGLAVHFMEAGHEAPEAAEVPLAHGEEAVHKEVQEEAQQGFWWLDIPLFTAGFAFLGGVVLLALSKLGVFPLIKREEDYYDQHSIKKREEKSKGGGH